jgi:diguanylate cyclase (GGDEF)-like protein
MICDAARTACHADGALLFELDPQRDALELTCTRGPRNCAIDTYTLSERLAACAVLAGRAHSSRDSYVDSDLEWLAAGWRDGGRLCLTYPLRARDGVVGALAVICLGRDMLLGHELWALNRVPEQAGPRLHDMRERDALKAKAAEAVVDPLTGIANLRGFNDALAAAGEGFGLLMVDFDDLKKLNEQAGYDAGDEVLVAIGAALRDEQRPKETAARLGGDEFMIVVPHATLPELEARAAVVSARLDALDVSDRARSLYHGASVGIALAQPGEAPEDVKRHASDEMRSQKRRRKTDRPR